MTLHKFNLLIKPTHSYQDIKILAQKEAERQELLWVNSGKEPWPLYYLVSPKQIRKKNKIVYHVEVRKYD